MSEMVERVTDAIASIVALKRGCSWEQVARAAIEAMRTPTAEMLAAVPEQSYPYRYGDPLGGFMKLGAGPSQCWSYMIDAALAEPGETS